MGSNRNFVRDYMYTLSLKPFSIRYVKFETHLIYYIPIEFNTLDNSVFQTSPLYLNDLVSTQDTIFYHFCYWFCQA